jgi:type II secretory pathway pseudopilin PulG
MTLIEMIGALTVVALLAVLTFAFTVRHLDQIAADREAAALTTLGGALERYVARTRCIPGLAGNDWATNLALEAGLDIGAVTNTPRNCRRVYWADPAGWLSTNLPYVQTIQSATNLTSPPGNVRIMLISTIAGSLPTPGGMLSDAAKFTALWSEDALPSEWGGFARPDDVKVERINLSQQFVRLVLSTYNSYTNGQYVIDDGPTNRAGYGEGVSGFFLRGTTLRLHSGWPSNTLEHTHILNQDTSFVFENAVWKSSLTGGRTANAGSGLGIVAAFLAARPNINAENYSLAFSNQQQVLIVDAFIQYMSNYNRWEAQGLDRNDPLRAYLQNTLQPYLMDRVQGLYTKIGGSGPDHYPTNNVIWPP